jgi:large conductance mechanosensitive channel
MIQEFKNFINRGNLIDLAVAFVLGVAFAALVTTFVERVVNPVIGLIFDTAGLDNWLTFGAVDPTTGAPAGSVGAFIGAVINFLIVAFVIFLVVKAYNRMRTAQEAAPTEEIVLLTEIRDSLRTR